MSSKISKKKMTLTKKDGQTSELRAQNQELKAKLHSMRRQQDAQRQRSVLDGFTKWRMVTYAWVVFFAPYGLYRIWSKESTFTRSERAMWTFMIIVYVVYFFRLILFS